MGSLCVNFFAEKRTDCNQWEHRTRQCRPTTSLTPYVTHHPTNGLTPYVTHHPTTSLTPNPSPRGEGSSMLLQRILFDAYPQHSASPPFHARGGGVISLVLLQCTLCSQGISLPSPLGEGLGVRPVVGWRVLWRVVCCVVLFVLFLLFLLFLSFGLYLSLPNMRSR